jgi:uncharacterized membrane protein
MGDVASGGVEVRLSPLEILSKLNSSYWFVPLVVTLGGVGLAILLLMLDSQVRLDPNSTMAVLRPSSAEGARALLSAVIGSMITAISVTFSVTIVALTVAAQHFGPRVLNNFVRQTSAQLVLGTFMATFAYSVLALGAIRGGAEADVPELAVSGAVVLVVLSIGALIYYVHHVSTTLQIGELAAAIVRDLRVAVSREEQAAGGAFVDPGTAIPDAPPGTSAVCALESGYVQRVDYDSIVKLASARDAVVWIRREPGAFLIAGTPLALVHPSAACDDVVASALRRACIVGRDRTLWHDPEFAVKQLVEIALRALSPGVNEPFTAMTCIDRLTEGLACVATAAPPPLRRCDAAGVARVWVQTQPFSLLLRAAFDPIRIFAGTNPAIYARLLDSLGELAFIVRQEGERQLLRDQAETVQRAAARALSDPEDLTYVAERHRNIVQQLAGRPAATRR